LGRPTAKKLRSGRTRHGQSKPQNDNGLLSAAMVRRGVRRLLHQPLREAQAFAIVATALGTMGGSASFTLQGVVAMATNSPRHGYERKRSQLKTKTMGQKHWTKRSRKTGEFMDQKKAGKFKSVRREKSDR
jgi:hypothetical protein